jgi:hypothetical protein
MGRPDLSFFCRRLCIGSRRRVKGKREKWRRRTGPLTKPPKGLDRRQCFWHVSYQFCDLSAEITVCAESEADARAKAVDQLRRRGLKVA